MYAEVLHAEVVADRYENCEASESYGETEENVWQAEAGDVRSEGENEGETECCGNGRDGVELGLDSGVAEGFDYGGCEV